VIVPSTGNRSSTSTQNGARTDTIDGADGQFTVSVPRIDWPSTWTLRATGNTAEGRGTRGAIPLHIEIESRDIALEPGAPRSWTLRLSSRTP
jgi:hypothetical protein